jgi:peptidoglycan/xylan/chitin deacetylase (PgdA/CDA1 family)
VRIRCSVAAILLLALGAGARAEGPVTAAILPISSGVDRNWEKPALGRSRSGAPEVLFTFDDGPSGSTELLLDTLLAHDVKAVFFMVGWRISARRDTPRIRSIVARMAAEGHAVGNHTFTHMQLCLRSNAGALAHEIDGAARLLESLSGMPAVLFRTPYGARCKQLEAALAARGLRHMHWDIDPQEWRTHDPREVQAKLVAAIEELGDDERAVILTHDTHVVTVKALAGVLDWIAVENGRRRRAGRPEIHILSPAEVAVEQLAPGVDEALEAATSLLAQVQRRFLAPLTARAYADRSR